MTLQITGEITNIGEIQQITDNFSKRVVTVKTDANSQYPQWIKLETNNTKNALLDAFKEGENVTIDFNLNGKIGSNFNSLTLWKINKLA